MKKTLLCLFLFASPLIASATNPVILDMLKPCKAKRQVGGGGKQARSGQVSDGKRVEACAKRGPEKAAGKRQSKKPVVNCCPDVDG